MQNAAIRDSRLIHALFIFGTFGALSLLIDLDHIPVVLQKGLSVSAENLITYGARPLHIPMLILLGIVCCISLASVYRLRNSAL